MGYAIRDDGLGWRMVNSNADLLNGESYSDVQPPAIEPSSIPQEVTRFQALASLHLTGLLEQVEAIMAAPETSVLTKLAWQNAQTFKRHSTMVLAIAEVLQLSEQQLDDLFITAAGVE